jgi:hypothetical protein
VVPEAEDPPYLDLELHLPACGVTVSHDVPTIANTWANGPLHLVGT